MAEGPQGALFLRVIFTNELQLLMINFVPDSLRRVRQKIVVIT